MKEIKKLIVGNMPWVILLASADIVFIFLLWLTSPAAFGSLTAIIVIFTVIQIVLGLWLDKRKQKKQFELAQSFLTAGRDVPMEFPKFEAESAWLSLVRQTASELARQSEAMNAMQMDRQSYQEFIEAWAHEIKTPLSLAMLVLNNNADEMSPHVYKRMEHVRYSIGEYVERILYFARLGAPHVDYRFEEIDLKSCVEESLDNFKMLLEDRNINLQIDIPKLAVASDRRTLIFVLTQLLGNAFKYADAQNGDVRVMAWQDEAKDNIQLAIRNNGKGVAPEDAPFIFDKGFTGNCPERKSATGIGLYLVKQYAKALSFEAELEEGSYAGKEFGIRLSFPKV
jgi:signal transduction histidine kinase